MPLKTIDQIDVSSKRVLMRVDFNVPFDREGRISDDRRIVESLPSIRSVVDRGGRLILMSHLGRPDEKGYEPEYSLNPVAEVLSQHLGGAAVHFPDTDCVSEKTAAAVESMKDGEVVLLENLRFHAGETANDAGFARRLARLGEIYCNDAFGTSHRDHASMVGVPRAMEGSTRVAGLLLKKEVEFFDRVLVAPQEPYVAILGGVKVSDKIGVILNLINRTGTVLVGGAMSYTFLKALGQEIGSSKAQLGMIPDALKIIDAAAASHTDLILPLDHIGGREITSHTPVRVFEGGIDAGWMGLDIGPKTTALFAERIGQAKTIVWNGPMGVFETDPFDVGTRQVAEAVAYATERNGAVSVVGGGDTAAAVERFGMADRFSHVSTGGGASLELLEGKRFNSIEILDRGA